MNNADFSEISRRLGQVAVLSVALIISATIGTSAQQGNSDVKAAKPLADPPVAIVGNHIIRESDVQRAMNALTLGDQIDVRSRRARFIDSLVREELIFQLALQKMQENRAVRDRIKSAVVGNMIEHDVRAKASVSDKQARDYYDATKDSLGGEHITLRDIQFADETTCRSQLRTIKSLADFTLAAKRHHVLKDLGEEGGEVGTVMTRHVIFGYGDKLAGLEQNRAHLILHDGRCHIVWITDRETRPVPTFEELRDRLIAGLKSGAEAEMLQKVIADAGARIGVTRLTKTEAEETGQTAQTQTSQTGAPQSQTAEAPQAANTSTAKQADSAAVQSAISQPPAPGTWRLTDQTGKTVSHEMLMGGPAIMAFGFTFCPDICPTTLLEMSNWIDTLGKRADKTSWSFVSVDPERDTPKVLKSYLEHFSDKIRGLTGAPQQLASLVSKYDITVRRVEDKDNGYSMDHSSSVLLLDANGKVFDSIPFGTTAAQAVEKIAKLLDAHADRKTN
ncbi:MAG: SCO family protein [Hyphomicrobiaceae bacterium]